MASGDTMLSAWQYGQRTISAIRTDCQIRAAHAAASRLSGARAVERPRTRTRAVVGDDR